MNDMDEYKEYIIQMIERINDETFLKRIYTIIYVYLKTKPK